MWLHSKCNSLQRLLSNTDYLIVLTFLVSFREINHTEDSSAVDGNHFKYKILTNYSQQWAWLKINESAHFYGDG